MEETRRRYPLLEAIIIRMRLPWYPATGIIAGVLGVLLLLAVYLDPRATGADGWIYWRMGLLPMAVVCYVLVIYPLMRRLRDQAVASIVPLLSGDTTARREIEALIHGVGRRSEVLAIGAGVAVWLPLSQPWRWGGGAMGIYSSVLTGLMFAVLGWLVFNGLEGTRRISRVARRHLRPDIFAVGRLVPVANWSLGISLAFVGGISISLAFQPLESLRYWQVAALYLILILVAVIVFFVSLSSTHAAILRAKQAELALARSNLDRVFAELKSGAGRGPAGGMETVYSEAAAWAAYERRVREAPEWPYNALVARRLAASVLLPGVIYGLKLLFGLPL